MTDVTDVAEAQIPAGSIAGLADLLPAPLKPLARLAWPVEKLDRRRSLIVLVVLWVLLTVAFGEIGRQLGTMHIPGDPSYRLEVLTPRFGGLKASLTEVLTTWNSWQVSNPVGVTGVPDTAPADLVRLSLFLDALYPAVSAALLGLLGWKALWPAPPPDQTTVRSRALRQVVAVAVATVPLYLLADYAENVVLSSAVFARPQGQTWLNVALLIVVFGAIVVAYGDAVSTWLRERQHGTARALGPRWIVGPARRVDARGRRRLARRRAPSARGNVGLPVAARRQQHEVDADRADQPPAGDRVRAPRRSLALHPPLVGRRSGRAARACIAPRRGSRDDPAVPAQQRPAAPGRGRPGPHGHRPGAGPAGRRRASGSCSACSWPAATAAWPRRRRRPVRSRSVSAPRGSGGRPGARPWRSSSPCSPPVPSPRSRSSPTSSSRCSPSCSPSPWWSCSASRARSRRRSSKPATSPHRRPGQWRGASCSSC